MRALRHRPPLNRLRLVRAPEDTVPIAAPLQVFVARTLGRAYLSALTVRERIRIQRIRAPELIEPGGLFIALVRSQRGLLVWLVVLILLGIAGDSLLPSLVHRIESAVKVQNWVAQNVKLPTDATLRTVLATLAGATGTILGIVLSITLIVFQTTAERYRSGRIVSFLLRERVTSAVIRLLALAFAYSIWVLMLFEAIRPGRLPYFSTLIALTLSTGGVLALITYRSHALLGYLPASIGRELVAEMVQSVTRVRTASSGPSVHQHAHDTVAEGLTTQRDLLRRLTKDSDVQGITLVLAYLDQFLEYYIRSKRRIDENSRWWARQAVRSDSPWTRMTEALASEGLMDPTVEQPDRFWLEREILDLTREAMQLRDLEVTRTVVRMLMRQLQIAFYSQEIEVCYAILEELRSNASAVNDGDDPALVEQLAQVPWLLFELLARVGTFEPRRVVAAEPWSRRQDQFSLPWIESQEARALGIKIRREQAIAGHVVTPTERMVGEVERSLQPKVEAIRSRLLDEAYTWLSAALRGAVDRKAPTAGLVAKQVLRALLRANHLSLPVRIEDDFSKLLARAYVEEKDATVRSDLREDSALLARELAEAQNWSAVWLALHAAVGIGVLAENEETNMPVRLGMTFDNLLTLAHIHAWAEFVSEADHVRRLTVYLDRPWRNLDGLAALVNDEKFSTTMALPFASGVKYHRWFQSLMMAVNNLPVQHEWVGSSGIPIERGRQHPSSLFAEWQMFHSYDECLRHLIRSGVELRASERQRLIDTLAQFARSRGANV